jgi:hypothetical protein
MVRLMPRQLLALAVPFAAVAFKVVDLSCQLDGGIPTPVADDTS